MCFRPCFNGAAPLKARKQNNSENNDPSGHCFNGAAPLKARKLRPSSWTGKADLKLQWGRAVEGAETSRPGRRDARARRFNGAAPLKARKREGGFAIAGQQRASMGPRR